MKIVLQRVNSAEVWIEECIVSKISLGLLIFIGIESDEDQLNFERIYHKIIHLRIFEDMNKKMNLSIKDIQGEILIVSQFTLLANLQKGHRPSFENAGSPQKAKLVYESFLKGFESYYDSSKIKSGVFGGDMLIRLENSGPATFFMEFST